MVEIKIPKLGLTMEKATIVEWRFRSGDFVRQGDIILVIETEKVSFEVPSPADGIIHPLAEEGAICEVEQIVGYIARDREEFEEIIAKYGSEKAEKAQPSAKTPSPPAPKRHGRQIKASPLARSIARSHGIDLALITGSGPGGRIVRADVMAFLETRANGKEAKAPGKEVLESIPITGIRKTIFENMLKSLSQSAQLTLHTTACAEALISLRGRFLTEPPLSFNAVFIKVAALALRRHPRINASVGDGQILVWKQVNVGLAMDVEDHLIVPVIKEADQKGLLEINQEINQMLEKARKGILSPDDLASGTFTITNLGHIDIDHFTPILRPPESAILGVGRIAKVPVVKGDRIVPEARISLSLTFDHRIIDGAPAARFLKTIKDFIEYPEMMLF